MSKLINLNNLTRFYNRMKALIDEKASLTHSHNAAEIIEDSEHKFVTEFEKQRIHEISETIDETNIYKKKYIITDAVNYVEYPQEYKGSLMEEQLFIDGIKLIRDEHYSIDDELTRITFTREYSDVEIELILFNKIKLTDITFASNDEIDSIF